jgi:hypothetical protein
MLRQALRLMLFGGIGFLSLLAIACGDDDDDDGGGTGGTGASQTEFCSDLEELEVAVNDVREINTSSTVDDAEAATEELEQALDDVKDSAAEAQQARVDAVETAFEELQETIESVEGSQTLGSAYTSVQNAIDNVSVSYNSLDTQAGCA